MKYRLITQIAEALLENQGAAAYLYVLEKLNESHSFFWREVLAELDKLDKLNKLKGEK